VFGRNKVLKILAFLCGGKNRELKKSTEAGWEIQGPYFIWPISFVTY